MFLSPPWGGPGYLNASVFDIETMMCPSTFAIIECARKISPNLCLFMPRNSDAHEVIGLCNQRLMVLLQLIALANGERCELEQIFLNNKLKALNFYLGDLAWNPE